MKAKIFRPAFSGFKEIFFKLYLPSFLQQFLFEFPENVIINITNNFQKQIFENKTEKITFA